MSRHQAGFSWTDIQVKWLDDSGEKVLASYLYKYWRICKRNGSDAEEEDVEHGAIPASKPDSDVWETKEGGPSVQSQTVSNAADNADLGLGLWGSKSCNTARRSLISIQ